MTHCRASRFVKNVPYHCKGGESSDSTGPIFIPRRRGAARCRSRRRAGLPTTSPTRGTASWIQISDYRPTSDEDGLTPHNAPLWARPDATANLCYRRGLAVASGRAHGGALWDVIVRPRRSLVGSPRFESRTPFHGWATVSYTHLTLPTIYSV